VRRFGILAAAALATLAAVPAGAGADSLQIKISEVNPGSGPGSGNGDFIELQMYAPGQNLVVAHDVDIYNAAGAFAFSSAPFSTNAPQGASQRTVIVGNPPGVTPDQEDLALDIPLAGGAACFGDGAPWDCVSWGSFPPASASALPDPQAANAPALSAGSSLTRSIAPGCPTLLEEGDDTANGAADFAGAAPSPRNNATPPTEVACTPPDPPPPLDTIPPITKITKAPASRTERDSAKFRFESNEPGSTFACSRDGKPFVICASPMRYRHLDDGRHRFSVRATDPAGNPDLTPARERWKVMG
jgi:hypothetical protein